MSLFGPEIIEVVVKDTQVKQLFQEREGIGAKILQFLHTLKENPQKVKDYALIPHFELLEQIGVEKIALSINGKQRHFERKLFDLLTSHHQGKKLFRGVDYKHYGHLIKTGNSKKDEDATQEEIAILKPHKATPKEIIWAWPGIEKAWEFVYRKNPQVIAVYNEDYFESLPEAHLYKIKEGLNFKHALIGVVVILLE